MSSSTHKFLRTIYYFLSCTWGFLMTAFGAIIAAVLICLGYKPKKHVGC